MVTKWYYNNKTFEAEDLLNAEIVSVKDRLDNDPTFYCEVKLLGGNETDGWLVPSEKLTKEQINSLDASDTTSKYYLAYEATGTTLLGVTAAEILNTLADCRSETFNNRLLHMVVKEYPATGINSADYVVEP